MKTELLIRFGGGGGECMRNFAYVVFLFMFMKNIATGLARLPFRPHKLDEE